MATTPESAARRYIRYIIEVAEGRGELYDGSGYVLENFDAELTNQLVAYFQEKKRSVKKAKDLILSCLAEVTDSSGPWDNDADYFRNLDPEDEEDEEIKALLKDALQELDGKFIACGGPAKVATKKSKSLKAEDKDKETGPTTVQKFTGRVKKVGTTILQLNAEASIRTMSEEAVELLAPHIVTGLKKILSAEQFMLANAFLASEHGPKALGVLTSLALQMLPAGPFEDFKEEICHELQIEATKHVQKKVMKHIAKPMMLALSGAAQNFPALLAAGMKDTKKLPAKAKTQTAEG